ncbi:MAG: adenylate kinase [Phycisphaerae bacterium]
MSNKRLIFLGPPGTGKGTQASRMSARFGLVALSSGDTLRNEIKEGTEVGRKASRYVEAGTLVPDDVITDVMLSAISKLPPDTGFILDGFPRTVPQAEALAAGLGRADMTIDAAIDFQMDDRLIVERIVTRRVCSDCGATYNLRSLPPQVEGVCDKCGGEVAQRVDDREDVIKTRLKTHRSQTAPLIEFYWQRGLLRTVDASQQAQRVEVQVVRVIEALG